jgi:hypothetical protein
MVNKTINFIEKVKLIHGDKYDYSLVNYTNNTTKVEIKCFKHGIFEQTPKKHLIGQGCPKCGMNKITNNEYINKVKLIHGDKYDYSLVNYIDSVTKIDIICKEHGIFNQIPHSHLSGNGCPKCVGINKTTNQFIGEAKIIHGDKYDYSLVDYIDSTTKVKIICPEHGTFNQAPTNHISNKQGCPICGNLLKKENTNGFIEKAKQVHGDKYDYSLVNYIDNKTKVEIICKEHGSFLTKPNNHLSGSGCPKCVNNQKKTNKNFIYCANSVHGDKYDYSLVTYTNNKTYIDIICKEHGIFKQSPNNHVSKKQDCPKCSLRYDKSEGEVKEFISSLKLLFEENTRKIIQPLELDIYIPSHNIAIEFDGLYWHSEKFKINNYHLNKTIECEKQGIQLIHIFEDEWIHKQDIVKSRLMNILGLTPIKIYGRKCIIKEISSKEAKEFLNNNHIQGGINSKYNIGLYYDDELVSLMTFGCLRKSMGNNSIEDAYELFRFCNKLNTTVIGGADKLLKYFIKTYKPNEIISYADRRWSQGNLYKKLGFEFIHNSKPNYFYINNCKREYRFKYRKDVLVKEGFDKNKTEREIMEERGFNRIYDCGNKKYILKILHNML